MPKWTTAKQSQSAPNLLSSSLPPFQRTKKILPQIIQSGFNQLFSQSRSDVPPSLPSLYLSTLNTRLQFEKIYPSGRVAQFLRSNQQSNRCPPKYPQPLQSLDHHPPSMYPVHSNYVFLFQTDPNTNDQDPNHLFQMTYYKKS